MNSTSKTRGHRLLAVAGFLAVLVAAAAPASAAPQQKATQTSTAVATDQSHKPGTKPTLVLVHGAWADGSGWSKVTRRLQNDGFTVRVPPNPLRSLPGDAATIRDFLSTLSGPIVLVAHSYGGAVITNAATGNPNVKALVYVDAFAPAEGEIILSLAGADSALAADPTTVFDFVPYPGAPPGDVDLYLKHDVFLTSFATGVPRPEAELLYASQRPLTLSSGSQPSGPPAWATIPSWYVLGTQDAIITPTAQQFMAERAHAEITRVKAGHLSMITQPQQVTAVIERAVQATN
ncbi:pimeloyl-ACP methyl ester carboxylesterase [Kribbella orskensis]|uniref:Pimeloyl-ACP methyl ester carboxylesterase n=1 Tax=Kribbella orskensis TaxID=2512216 RepID=A0ABY2BAL0_9ACTN|nr:MULTISPECIES: alpha/beta hydrolase [Kribbella]TCN32938.1 pimeloyl-ACP methyl ester carboxylesterase [Kribbella sp. VKM Ac-2500]TCO13188.1 pimeloyl-ACP methyl ester carboxylesterase [Kribbella orskensis]